jgi:mannitol/fructose-specific phosphotransferase system IIA component (Ntr-type)
MDFSRHIRPEQILLNVRVRDKAELFDRMIAALESSRVVQRQSDEVRAQIKPAVLAREREGSTGLARGIAYPHARITGFQGFALCLATLEQSVEYETLDGEPVRLALMALTPQEAPMVGIQTASYFANLMSNAAPRSFLLGATDPHEVYRYLATSPRFTSTLSTRSTGRLLSARASAGTVR